MPQKFQNFINGKWTDSNSGRTFKNRNPANWEDVVGLFPKSTKEDVEDAVKAARAAYEKWRLVPAPARGDIMRKVGDLLVKYKEELAREMTREMEKFLPKRAAMCRKELIQHTMPQRKDEDYSVIQYLPKCPINLLWRYEYLLVLQVL
jgi:acyl-CoA reductase-like NAD-dependent aldehyde dehydrogenase